MARIVANIMDDSFPGYYFCFAAVPKNSPVFCQRNLILLTAAYDREK